MKIIISTIFLLAATCASHAATGTFNATLNGINYTYTTYQSSFTVSNITSNLSGFNTSLNYIAICFDFTKRSYWEADGNVAVVNRPVSETVNTDLTASAIFNDTPAQDEALVVAQTGYLVDNFFITKFVNGNATTRTAFAQVIWELTLDGGISGKNLDFAANDFNRTGNANFNTGTALRTEMDNMRAAVASSGVTSSYAWTTVHYLVQENDPLNQDYLLLAAPVPEAGSSFLIVLLTTISLTYRWRNVGMMTS